jgi:type IV secretory pathway TraG/TraD family ATPase VirD4
VRNAERIPRNVRHRGYLAPGDDSPPPGADLLDYRGVLAYRDVLGASALGRGAVGFGRAVDVGRRATGGEFCLPLERLFQHVSVIAPPGKGKTFGVIAPLVVRCLRAGSSVVVLDVTGDLPEQIRRFSTETQGSGAQSSHGAPSGTPVRSLHWSVHPDHGRHRWNPLEGVDPNDIMAIEGLKSAIIGDKPADPKHMDFHDRDTRIFGSLVTLVLSGRRSSRVTLTDVARVALSREALAAACRDAPRHLVAMLEDILSDDSSALWGLRNKLEPFLDPSVIKVTDRSDFAVRDVLEQPTLLVIGAELELRQRSRVASALLVNAIVAALQSRYGQRARPVVLVLDEAPVLAERLDLTSILATARGANAGVVLAAQHVTQFGDENTRTALLDSCDTMMLLGGATEPSAKMFQGRLGQREVRRVSYGRDAGARRANVRSEASSERVEIIGARELFEPPFSPYTAFLHSRTIGVRPIVLDLDRSRRAT